ncbi:hypothetical protein P153DRAFT_400987 [Dothidotthia symphoricarpi CBS 119687]|uniref:Uncharacterized protein n=1 Tax=Dothidotthia symphoricarpi CBS 119687 TaxID=1392245 RepID=A0A6A5ZXU8_9PLEO|nr:uncharacterized protein P153DRAFT_400987 [Dothidotthia symphoricarpi CBS 119687]KAF2124359.1 hypothetical protein P153DRAFT_400987 [Dothidotthia symphoricarpi CBS 119687]
MTSRQAALFASPVNYIVNLVKRSVDCHGDGDKNPIPIHNATNPLQPPSTRINPHRETRKHPPCRTTPSPQSKSIPQPISDTMPPPQPSFHQYTATLPIPTNLSLPNKNIFPPTPWETKLAHIFFERVFSRFLQLSEHHRLELGGVVYRALLAILVESWYAIGVLFLVPYAYAYREDVERVLTVGWCYSGCWAFLLGVLNRRTGRKLRPQSGDYYIQLVSLRAFSRSWAKHNSPFLRLSIWTLKRICAKESRLGNTLRFLLQHPRRCFVYLVPTACETSRPSIPLNTRIIDGVFQATGLRTSERYITAFNPLAPACLRKTNTYEEASIGLLASDANATGISPHLQRQLAYDIYFQVLASFYSALSSGNLINSAMGFSPFALLFEDTSAYGTVGLSTGIPDREYSLSGAFSALSKVIVLLVRPPPRYTSQYPAPGEELMRRMDRECGYVERGDGAVLQSETPTQQSGVQQHQTYSKSSTEGPVDPHVHFK